MKAFLTAEWKNLINITYAVDPKLLIPYLPKGLSLDIIEGKAFMSLVAFEFNSIKVKGLPIPFHRNFPEINLRFYVNKNGKRGVVFIKEFVPKYFVALVANRIYNEPYEAISMQVSKQLNETEITIEHSFTFANKEQHIQLKAEKTETLPDEKSTEHFFKEHDYGFGRDKKGNTLAYTVEHPRWSVYKVSEYKLDVDFGAIYGAQWDFLKSEKPYSVLLAKGSEVVVYDKEKG